MPDITATRSPLTGALSTGVLAAPGITGAAAASFAFASVAGAMPINV